MDKLLPAFIEHRTAHLLAYLTHPSALLSLEPITLNTVLSRFIMLFAALLTLRLLATAYACIYHPHHPRAPSPTCAPWSYSGETGPLLWAGLPKQYGCTDDWTACRTGRYQSPVVIYTASSDWTPLPPGALDVAIDDVQDGGAQLWNLNTTLEVPVHDGVPRGELKLRLPGENKEMSYTMLQFHFHTPSEHRIDEEHYPLEMHLVFQSQSIPHTLAVIGILFQLVPTPTPNANPLLAGVFANLPLISSSTPHTRAPTGLLPFTPLLTALHSGAVYTYTGSLTTPPCTENVRWLVLRDPQPLGVEIYNGVKAVMKFNARYSQNVLGGENLLEIARRERSAFGSAGGLKLQV